MKEKNNFSKEELTKKIKFCEESIKLADDTILLLEEAITDDEDMPTIIDLGDIVHNLAVMSPHSSHKFIPALLEEYRLAKQNLTKLKEGYSRVLPKN